MSLRSLARLGSPWRSCEAWESMLRPALSVTVSQARAFCGYRELQRTPLFDFHVEQGGKLVPFAGWEMPIQYKDSLMESAKWCRSKACIFDVSHMCAVTLQGKDSVRFLEYLVVGDIQSLTPGTGTLTVITNENGGIIDDSVTTKVRDDHIYMVFNAACREKDLEHFNSQLKAFDGDCKMTVHDDRSLIALQGPKAHDALQQHVQEDLAKFYFGNFMQGVNIAGANDCWMMRTGYTGEDGFELSIPANSVEKVTRTLCENNDVKMAGLGARDSLRLEAGLCLYGNDLTEETTPIEASLKWTIGKRRREKFDFIGGEKIKKQIDEGISKRRVGILSEGAPPRAGAELLLASDGTKVGTMTSGAFSPNLNKNVGMAYVDKPYDKAGTELKVVVRGKQSNASVEKPPFVKVTYYKG